MSEDIRLDFEVEALEEGGGEFPTPQALADAIQNEIDNWEDHDYRVTGIRYAYFDDVPTDANTNKTGLMKQVVVQGDKIEAMQKRDAKQLARIAEQNKLIAHLEHKNDNLNDRNRNLVQKNDNQVEIIKQLQRRNNSQYNDLENATTKLREWRESNKALNQINDEQASVIQANRDNILALENRLNEALIGWEEIQADRTRLRTKVAELVATDLNHRAENVGAVRMIAKIVDAMQAEGFDIAGWGNDDQLTMLENSTASARDHLDDVMAELDAIRTER